MSHAGTGASRPDKSVSATSSSVPAAVVRAESPRRRGGAAGVVRPVPVRSAGCGFSTVLVLAVLCVCITAANARINCRIHVFHPHCRGVAARAHSGADDLSPLQGAQLRRLLRRYIHADQRRTTALDSLGQFLNEERPVLPEPRRDGDSLLRRLVRMSRYNEDIETALA